MSCQAGTYCPTGTRVALTCPRGHYCPEGTADPIECEAGTYNNYEGGIAESSCVDCLAGYNCNDRAISDRSNYVCQHGHYCPRGTFVDVACPPGTFRPMSGGKAERDCYDCLGGHFCEESGTAVPQLCPNGTYCAPGSDSVEICEPGRYCAAESESQTLCPAGFYCEGASEYYYKCLNGTYCPAGSSQQIPCPGGTFGNGVINNYNMISSCVPCGRGLYSIVGAQEGNDRQCLDCAPGYVCVGGSKDPFVNGTNSAAPTSNETNRGYECPKGYYCPLNSYVETPCPAGTYNKYLNAKSVDECFRCLVGYY